MEIDTVPEPRVRSVNTAPVQEKQDYVLYWMTAFRRTQWNFSLDRAVDWAASLRRPLIVFEPLSCSYRWASDRFHQFVLDGMEDNGRALAGHPAAYLPYVEPHPGAGRYLLETLASRACVVVTDDYPAFFLPGMVRAAGKRLDVRLEAVDSNGLLPLASASRAYPTAASFRRHLQGKLAEHLKAFPREHPFEGVQLPQMQSPLSEIRRQWPSASGPLRDLPINHAVPPVALRGGRTSGSGLLGVFVSDNLGNYASARNHPDGEATSGLSPYLHFGHISAHEVFAAVAEKERWSFDKHRRTTNGKRLGWWKMSESAEEFLEQLVTWRELGFNFAAHRADYDRYTSLPAWALATLEKHALDQRNPRYTLRQFERAGTHDPLWNAAQRQLVAEGRIHGYLRMLWGKKIMEWSASPEHALRIMIELNNKYALDGRDPNSYAGIFWVLGRYDRPWFPERPVFGAIRYMSSDNARRKLRLKKYLGKYG